MGAWGAGLFQDDTACDVRDEFIDLVGEGLSTEQATADLEKRWGTPGYDPDEESVFWIALAATQFRYGRLLPHVRDRAIALIDDGGDVERFDAGPSRRKRTAALIKLREQLLGPPRKTRAIRKEPLHDTPHQIGAILTYRLPSGRLSLWRVTEHKVDKGGRYARVEVLPGLHERVPSELRLAFMGGLRDPQGRFFEMTLMPWHEASDQLSPTSRGRSLLAILLLRVRGVIRKPQGLVCIIPMKRGPTETLHDLFGMS